MIITVTLNAAIDKSLSVPNFRLGRRHRTVEQTTMPGGKGVNVARTLKSLGQPVIATGFAGGPTGTRIVEQLTEESILNDFVRIREESRTNTAVHDPTNGETTEINERGPAVSGKEIELFRDKLLYLARGADVVVFAGSLPRGVEADVYAQLIKEVRKAGVQTVVDADGDPMRLAVRAEPDVISPNVIEAEELVGHEFNDDEDRVIAVREMVALGAREAIMTLPDGCVASVLLDGAPTLHRVWIEPREAVAAVGAGDAFLAGFVAARYTGSPAAECLRFGVACGAESTQRLGAGLIEPREVERLLGRDRGAAPRDAGRGPVERATARPAGRHHGLPLRPRRRADQDRRGPRARLEADLRRASCATRRGRSPSTSCTTTTSTSTASRARTACATSSPRAGSSCPRAGPTTRRTRRPSAGWPTQERARAAADPRARRRGLRGLGALRAGRARRRPAPRGRLLERQLPRRARGGRDRGPVRGARRRRRGRGAPPAGKPAPDTFLGGARASGSSPRTRAVFEDALAGVQAGRAGGFGFVVGVDRAGQRDALRAHGADVVVDDLAELLGR